MAAKKPKNVVIVESPGKVKTISKVLGKEFLVKASVGHIRDLNNSKKKDKKDSIVAGVQKDFTPTYVNILNKQKVIDDLKKAVKDAEKVYLCPDPDREGEAIAWHLAEVLNLDPDHTYRVTFDEITPRGIRAAFEQPRKIDMDRVNAQQARRVLDRIVGYQLSPLLWEKIARGLSAGRVQSVAVKLIAEREAEIDAFSPEEYWTLGGRFEFAKTAFDADLRALDGKQVATSAEDLKKFQGQDDATSRSGILRTLISAKDEAHVLADILEKASYEVSNFEVKEVKDNPYPPFATSQLQQAAANRLGFDARRTMRVAQELYQGVQLKDGPVALITYMRTDSFRISNDALNDTRGFISNAYGKDYLPEKPNFYKSRKGGQDAHECIRPTNVALTPAAIKSNLSDPQYKMYKLIWERFVACQMNPALFDATTCDIAARGPETRNAVFRATGRVLKFDGWLAVYGGAKAADSSHVDARADDRSKGDEDTSDEEAESTASSAKGKAAAGKRKVQILPKMEVGSRPDLKNLETVQRFTSPPARYTEASLVKILEREGIGRPSTYAAIISTIQDREYVEKITQSLNLPKELVGISVQSGSLKGEIVAVNGGTLRLRTTDGFECSTSKGRQLQLAGDGGRFEPVVVTQNKMVGGRGAFAPTALGEAVTQRLDEHFDHSIMDIQFTRRMEDELDKIEEAHLDWKAVLNEFYGPFTKDLTTAGKEMKSSKADGEKSDVKCPECKSPMEKRLNKYGYYLRCTGDECKSTLRLDRKGNVVEREKPKPTGIKCDLCGNEVVRATGRFGPYLACEQYALKKCTFTMKINKAGEPVRKFSAYDTDIKCDKCEAPMVVRMTFRGKNRRPFLSCSKYPKCRNAKDMPEELSEIGDQARAQFQENQTKDKRDLEIMRRTDAAMDEEQDHAVGAVASGD